MDNIWVLCDVREREKIRNISKNCEGEEEEKEKKKVN